MDGPHARVQRLLEAWLDLRRRIAAGEAPAIAVFNDIRALQKPQRGVVLQAYMRFFAKIREIFVAPELAWLDAQACTARAQILTEQIFWAVAWLPRYDLEDYDRIRERMYDIFVHGLAAPGAQLAAAAVVARRRAAIFCAGADATRDVPDRSHAPDQRAGLSRRFGGEDLLAPERHQGLVLPSPRSEGRAGRRLLQAQLRSHAARAARRGRRRAGRARQARDGRGGAGRLPAVRPRPAAAHLGAHRAARVDLPAKWWRRPTG